MIKKINLIIITLLLTLLGLSVVSALTATIDNPKMVVYKNITAGQTITFEESVVVQNENDYDILIRIKPDDFQKDEITVHEPNFTLVAGETKIVKYTVKISESGNQGGDILVTFIDPNTNAYLSLAQRFVVDATEIEGERNYTRYFVTAGVVILILIILIIIYANKSNMRKKK